MSKHGEQQGVSGSILAPRMARARQIPGFGRRLRAAIALEAKHQRDTGRVKARVAKELNVSTRTLERMVLDQSPPNDWEVARLAEVLQVPEWFLREGFNGADAGEEDLATVAGELLQEIVALREDLRGDRGAGAESP